MDDERVAEINRISGRSFSMAVTVHKDPLQRGVLSDEATRLRARLLVLAHELEADPVLSRLVGRQLSESILDLDYVIAATDMVSLRLGDLIRWG